MKRKFLFIILIFFFSFLSLFFSCDDSTGPPNNNAKLNLTLEDVSCTEVWLKLEVNNPALKNDVIIYRDEQEIKRINLIGNDTILYDENLLSNKTYTYQAKNIVSEKEEIRSKEVAATTMDTTSHNFTFETFTFGEHSSSVLYDVAIVNENCIWAVGEIYMNDSSGNPDPNAYNIIHWDGNLWTPHRIQFYTFCPERTGSGSYPANSILAFDEKNIWITSGSQITQYDGEKQTYLECIPVSAIKMWGTNNNDIYVVGVQGGIAHYQNGVWRKIESGTDVDLKDIYGTPDGKNIWVSGYEDFKPTILLKISNMNVETIFNTRDYISAFYPDHISGEITSIWTNNNNFVYIITPYSLYRKSIYINSLREEALRFGDPLTWLGRRVRGNKINNIFIAGNRGYVNHYNGITFKTYQEPADNNITYYGLDVRSNLSIICGRKFENGISDKAIITLIK